MRRGERSASSCGAVVVRGGGGERQDCADAGPQESRLRSRRPQWASRRGWYGPTIFQVGTATTARGTCTTHGTAASLWLPTLKATLAAFHLHLRLSPDSSPHALTTDSALDWSHHDPSDPPFLSDFHTMPATPQLPAILPTTTAGTSTSATLVGRFVSPAPASLPCATIVFLSVPRCC